MPSRCSSTCSCCCSWSAAREGTGLARWGAAGLVGGLAAVTRPNIMLFLLLAACALPWLRPRPARGRYLRQLLAALVGFACVVGPVTWRNAAVGGELVLVSANGGGSTSTSATTPPPTAP